jgi:hypothetical protein
MTSNLYTHIRVGNNSRILSSQTKSETPKILENCTPGNLLTTSDFPKYDIQYALNRPGMHHVGHTSHFNKTHKFQSFKLQSKKAYINLELETKTNCSDSAHLPQAWTHRFTLPQYVTTDMADL